MDDAQKLQLLKQYFESAKMKGFRNNYASTPKAALNFALETLESLDWDIDLAIKYHNYEATKEERAEIYARQAEYEKRQNENLEVK